VLSTLNGEATTFDQGLPRCRAQHLEPADFHTAVLQIQNSNFKSDLIDHYNLQVEQQFGANVIIIRYVSNIGRHFRKSSTISTNPHHLQSERSAPREAILAYTFSDVE
jgi:hypothetical protein